MILHSLEASNTLKKDFFYGSLLWLLKKKSIFARIYFRKFDEMNVFSDCQKSRLPCFFYKHLLVYTALQGLYKNCQRIRFVSSVVQRIRTRTFSIKKHATSVLDKPKDM